MPFDLYVGIDYSGARSPNCRLSALQVYAAFGQDTPQRVSPPAAKAGPAKNWSRKEIARWLSGLTQQSITFIAGIDHGFSFPSSYFERYGLASWPAFLDDFCEHWPTDEDHMYVDFIRDRAEGPPDRTGANTDLRLTERWTSSAKSVFHFDVQGQVAKSTHAGLPWLRRLREEAGDGVHFWPFDGWQPEKGKSVLAEVFPSILRHRYDKEDRTVDQHDAYSVARWLSEMDGRGDLASYYQPPLTEAERARCRLEGWILGVI